jgi:NAD(P)-dependent dehydrogenase (short-subunit alcohol dehydrogenase family)
VHFADVRMIAIRGAGGGMAKVLITGASKGIGRETSLLLARAGHSVVATMRKPAESDLADVCSRDGLPIIIAELDVDSDASVAKVFGSGGDGAAESLDALVNNAGVYSINAVEDESLEQFQAVMNTNFFGTLRCCKAVAGAMRRRGAGAIVNVTSVAGRIVGPASGAYAASKFATEAMTEALAACA